MQQFTNDRVPILLYHSIAEKVSPRYSKWAVNPTLFAEHMDYLQKEAYSAFTVSQLVQMTHTLARLPAKVVVITFDDGLDDFYTSAFPVLHQYCLPATLYITTGYVGGVSNWLKDLDEGNRPMMSWSQIAELSDQGIECGAHSHKHLELDVLSLNHARREIIDSKAILEEKLEQPVTTFAYPYGYNSPQVRQIVKQANFTSACSVNHAMSFLKDDCFALSRIVVASSTSVNKFAALLAGQGLPIAPMHERMRTKAWRLLRRLRACHSQNLALFNNERRMATGETN